MKFSVVAELLTNAYFGEIKPLASGIFSESLPMPSIYTFAGALFTRLLEKNIDLTNILNENRICGIYLQSNKEYFIPITPLALEYNENQRRLKLNEDNYQVITDNYATTYNISRYLRFYIPRFNFNREDLKKPFYISINSLKDNAVIKQLDINLLKGERTRVALDYKRKAAEEGKLFSLTILYKTNIGYCIDVELPLDSSIDEWIGHFGGESTLARFRISNETPLLDIINQKSSNRYLAISPIALKLIDGNLICKLGRVESIIGSVGMLGGWDLKENMSKKLYACIEPGSIFCINDSNMSVNEDRWYFNILSCAIPI